MNREIHLVKRPEATPTHEHLNIVEQSNPKPEEGEVLLRTLYVSVDPYMRGRMSDAKSYIEPFQLNEPISGGAIAQVTESRSEQFNQGDIVTGALEWKEYSVADEKSLRKVDPSLGPVTTSLGILGMPGLTAYFGLIDIGAPKEGETLVVSGAAGAVGSAVVQIGKIYGCRVVGIAGTKEKTRYLTDELGVDVVINYKNENVAQALEEACPNGVDVYFDNVGGDISDSVYPLLNKFARIVQCGAISSYNTPNDQGPRIHMQLIKSSALVKGFTVGDYQERFSEGFQHLSKWLQEGKLTYEETIVEGFDQIPDAFFGLFKGENLGKQLVKVADPE
ncbi:putative NADP-dependent oxidoreductase YfmJ [Halobacillus andaensis]|uniref:NADP-dependent oxidoreductase YfmJ n=1 Tax=Halobacillus andaensis TaxID=1176239 RepID=A0A917B461_HALAA|nr:NADP-dependent oxidoreductase [Halobacillus andaensis]MBP2004587.1 NADPH-dependent curcumin reductase CurA [Halobacillus andaensis]GGF20522.1 putative NADP-dependent oxidoreductase YfmJ [Halobacillus andaensis]